ncbi:MAG: hypothetical protein ACKVKE_04795, partial [Candidatus Pelagibacterales bacterium]
MSKNKKIILSTLIVLTTFFLAVFLKLAFGYINSSYLSKKISTYVFEVSGKQIELDEVRLHLSKGIGLAVSIPNAEIYLNDSIKATNTIIDINILSIALKGVSASKFKISSQLSLYRDQIFELEIISKDKNVTINKFSSDNFSLIDEINLKNNNYHIVNINSVFTKSFIDHNLRNQIEKIKDEYGIELSNFFFEGTNSYNARLKINLKKQEIRINKLENKHRFDLKFKIDYSESDKKLELKSTLPSVSLIKILNNISAKRDTNNKKILKTFSDLLYDEQNIKIEFSIDENFKPKDIQFRVAGKINLNYQFDDNQDPSFIKGIAPYNITIIKKDLLNDLFNISSNINLNNTQLYIRQINLIKPINEVLNVKIDSLFDI